METVILKEIESEIELESENEIESANEESPEEKRICFDIPTQIKIKELGKSGLDIDDLHIGSCCQRGS